MQILAMTHGYVPDTPAGAETALHNLLRAAVDAGHTVDVQLSENRRAGAVPYVVDGVTVHPYLDTGGPFRWIGTADRHPAVLVGQLQNINRAAALGAAYRIPVVHVVHNNMDHTRHAIRVGPSDLVVYNTEWVRDSITGWLDDFELARPRREMVVHPPVRVDEFRQAKPGDRITLVNLNDHKGSPVFYELARRMPDRRFLAVVGSHGEQIISALPNVDIIGPINPAEMADKVYARTKVLLMPSAYESYGLAAIEASAGGIPVLASHAPGLREALGDDGTFLDRDDIDGWEAALRKVLSPRGWAAASKRSLAVAARLSTDADLERWVKELEALR